MMLGSCDRLLDLGQTPLAEKMQTMHTFLTSQMSFRLQLVLPAVVKDVSSSLCDKRVAVAFEAHLRATVLQVSLSLRGASITLTIDGVSAVRRRTF